MARRHPPLFGHFGENSRAQRREVSTNWAIAPLSGRAALTGQGHGNDQMLMIKGAAITQEITSVFLLLFRFCSVVVVVVYSGDDGDGGVCTHARARTLFVCVYVCVRMYVCLPVCCRCQFCVI